jgi:hypothetical protein
MGRFRQRKMGCVSHDNLRLSGDHAPSRSSGQGSVHHRQSTSVQFKNKYDGCVRAVFQPESNGHS